MYTEEEEGGMMITRRESEEEKIRCVIEMGTNVEKTL